MKRLILNLSIAAAALFLISCQPAERPETAFFRNFNLGAIVDQMKAPGLGPRSGAGSFSAVPGGTTGRRRTFDLEYVLDEHAKEQFDADAFLSELKSRIAEEINGSGARTGDAASRDGGFRFDYSEGGNRGLIEVACTHFEGNKFKVSGVIYETARIAGSN